MVKIKKAGTKSWVTFTLPKEIGSSVELSGEWSGWEREPMRKKKSGEFYLRRKLPNRQSYEFGYCIDGTTWYYEESLELVASPFDSYNALLVL